MAYPFIIALLWVFNPAFSQNISGYSITTKIVHCKGGEQLFLQQYRGSNLSNIDFLVLIPNKEMIFHHEKSLHPGMYAISVNKTLLSNFFMRK